MTDKSDNLKQNNIKLIPTVYFILQILFAIGLSFWQLYNNSPNTGDDVEHIHSAWLVFQGKIPYIDFFQHHNPLLWYLFAPLVGYFAYDLVIFDIVRIVSTLVMFAAICVTGLIVSKFISKNKYAGILAIASVFPSYVIFSGLDFRPDNYMILSFISGIYFYFSYHENHQIRNLILSFFCMFLSFMFMQKIIFIMIFFGCVVLFDLYKKQIVLSDFYKALILPLIGALVFLGWLVSHDMIEKYWMTNYIFNLYIPDVYWGLVERTRSDFYVLSAIAFLGCIFFLIKGNKYARIMSILWLAEASQRFFYFSLDRHYYYLLQIFNAVIVGAILWEVLKRAKYIVYLLIILSAYNVYIQTTDVWRKKVVEPYHRYTTPKYIIENTNPCDSVLNGYGLTYSLFNKDITYYWNLNGQLDVIGNNIGLAPLPDLNRAVLENLPKFIYTDPYWDEKKRKKHEYVIVHQIAPELRDKFYEQSVFTGIFVLKQKYQTMRRCRYDITTDSWSYYYKEKPWGIR